MTKTKPIILIKSPLTVAQRDEFAKTWNEQMQRPGPMVICGDAEFRVIRIKNVPKFPGSLITHCSR